MASEPGARVSFDVDQALERTEAKFARLAPLLRRAILIAISSRTTELGEAAVGAHDLAVAEIAAAVRLRRPAQISRHECQVAA